MNSNIHSLFINGKFQEETTYKTREVLSEFVGVGVEFDQGESICERDEEHWSLNGHLANMYIWSRVLKENEIYYAYRNVHSTDDLIVHWDLLMNFNETQYVKKSFLDVKTNH